jgi:hypothetical protein
MAYILAYMLEHSEVGIRNWTSVSKILHLRLATFSAVYFTNFYKATNLGMWGISDPDNLQI